MSKYKRKIRAAVASTAVAAVLVGGVGVTPAAAGPRDTICHYMPFWCGGPQVAPWWW